MDKATAINSSCFPNDAAILTEMTRCDGDAEAAWRTLCSRGVLHESYSAQAVLRRFRVVLDMTAPR